MSQKSKIERRWCRLKYRVLVMKESAFISMRLSAGSLLLDFDMWLYVNFVCLRARYRLWVCATFVHKGIADRPANCLRCDHFVNPDGTMPVNDNPPF